MPTTEELTQRLHELARNTTESKTQRLQVLITPTMYKTLKAASAAASDAGESLSVNKIVNDALRAYFLGKGEDVE